MIKMNSYSLLGVIKHIVIILVIGFVFLVGFFVLAALLYDLTVYLYNEAIILIEIIKGE